MLGNKYRNKTCRGKKTKNKKLVEVRLYLGIKKKPGQIGDGMVTSGKAFQRR